MLNISNIFPDLTADLLKGGKAAAIGEIREFGGKKYKKTSNGWRPVPKKESVAKESQGESTSSNASKIIDKFKTINSKYSDRDKMSLEKTDSGNWRLYYDGKYTGTTLNKDIISEANARKEGFIKQIESKKDEQDKIKEDVDSIIDEIDPKMTKEDRKKYYEFRTTVLRLRELDKVQSDFKNQLTELLGDKIPISSVSVSSRVALIRLKDSATPVEVYFDDGAEEREYKVQTNSYGSITPNSQYANHILLQAELLTNKSLIEAAKNVITKVSNLTETE